MEAAIPEEPTPAPTRPEEERWTPRTFKVLRHLRDEFQKLPTGEDQVWRWGEVGGGQGPRVPLPEARGFLPVFHSPTSRTHAQHRTLVQSGKSHPTLGVNWRRGASLKESSPFCAPSHAHTRMCTAALPAHSTRYPARQQAQDSCPLLLRGARA